MLGDRRLNADLVRVIMSSDPNKCGAIEPEIAANGLRHAGYMGYGRGDRERRI